MAYLPNIFADNFYLASVITWRELVRYKLEDSPDPLIFWGRIVFALHKPAMEFEVVDKYRTRPFFARLATLKLTRFFFPSNSVNCHINSRSKVESSKL